MNSIWAVLNHAQQIIKFRLLNDGHLFTRLAFRLNIAFHQYPFQQEFLAMPTAIFA